MNWRKVTKILLVVVASVLILYDFIPFMDQERGDTISEVILFYAMRSFTLPVVFGVLCGHFFWAWEGHYPKPKILVSGLAFVVLLDVLSHVFDIGLLRFAQTYPILWFVPGIPLGHFFWPQQREDKL